MKTKQELLQILFAKLAELQDLNKKRRFHQNSLGKSKSYC